MAAEIIQFPKKNQPLKVAKSVDLHYCWDCRLNNPLLNSIFKSEVCYVERWFLQTRHLLNNEEVDHPLIKTLLNQEDSTLDLLVKNTEKDLAVQRYFADVAYKDATDVNISKLNRWLVKWQGLQQYRQRF